MATSTAIINTVATVMPGFGSPGVVQQSNNQALSGASPGAQAIALTSPAYVTRGKVRIQIIGGGSSDVTVALTLSCTDGTSTVQLATIAATAISNAANSGMDFLIDFIVDIQATTFTLTPTIGGTTKTATLNWEVAGNP